MRIGVLLPHTKLYGGVKRFLELGNIFTNRGCEIIIFTEEGKHPTWFDFKGKVLTFESLKDETLDALFFTETEYLELALTSKSSRKIFYFINPKENLKLLSKHADIEFFANSSNLIETALKKFNIKAFPAFGGVNLKTYFYKNFEPRDSNSPFVVMAYGRMARSVKGTKYVVQACRRLVNKGYNVELLLFDTPVNEKMVKKNSAFKTTVPYTFVQNHPVEQNFELFHKSHVFVSAESKAGWSNTSAEAMACGIPVIGTVAGTNNFLFHNQTGIIVTQNSRRIANAIEMLINNEGLRLELARNGRKKIEEFDWEKLADRILDNFAENSR